MGSADGEVKVGDHLLHLCLLVVHRHPVSLFISLEVPSHSPSPSPSPSPLPGCVSAKLSNSITLQNVAVPWTMGFIVPIARALTRLLYYFKDFSNAFLPVHAT